MSVKPGERPRLFGTNGIRGRPNELLTPDFCLSIGKAAATRFGAPEIAIGRDTRRSGDFVLSSVAAGVLSTGTNLIDLGILPTPALQYYCKTRKIPGIVITASHNPPEFNGIKCIDSDGTELSAREEEEIEKIHYSGNFRSVDWKLIGTFSKDDTAVTSYIEAIRQRVSGTITGKSYRIAVDPACGAAYASTPRLLSELGCRITSINCYPDGLFTSRNPEPRPENLGIHISMMKEGDFDLGIAHDGDADRAAFVDENGDFVEGDRILTLLVKHLSRKGDVIVTPVSTSDSVDDVAGEIGARVLRTRIGAPVVARSMIDNRATLGGEENGGVIFGDHQYCRDGAMTAAYVLSIMSTTGKTLSSLLSEIKKYSIRKGSVHFTGDWNELSGHIERSMPGSRIDRTDGLKIFGDGGWALIRKSGTEPIVRIYAHAENERDCTAIFGKFRKIVEEFTS